MILVLQIRINNKVMTDPANGAGNDGASFNSVFFQVFLEHGRQIVHTLINMLTTPLAYGKAHPWWAFFVRQGGNSHGV